LWRLFADLMDSDCLNADKPDMFLAMKNKLKIMIKDSARITTASSDSKYSKEIDFSEQLREAFSLDIIEQKPHLKSLNSMQATDKPNGLAIGLPFANQKK